MLPLEFRKRFNPFAPCAPWVGHNTDLPSDSNISKMALKLLMFKVCVVNGTSKIEFFNFSGTERVKQSQKI